MEDASQIPMPDSAPSDSGDPNEIPAPYTGLNSTTRFDSQKRKVVIPHDTSKYPGFPEVEKMSEEDANEAVIQFWKVWRKTKQRAAKILKSTLEAEANAGIVNVRSF